MTRQMYVSEDKAAQFEAVIGVFSELFKELKELGKKKPDATLSSSKVKIINRVLEDAKTCLSDAPDYKYLDFLDDDTLPQYGDAILILSQYEGALKSFKARHHGYVSSEGRENWFFRKKKVE